MLTRQSLILTLLLASFCCDQKILAQESADRSAHRTPGVWHKGQFLGYVPGHLKGGVRKTQTTTQASPNSLRPAPESGDRESTAATASFQEAAPVELLPLPGESVEIMEEPLPADSVAISGGACCGSPWLWGRADYLLWWTRGMRTPPLITTSPAGTAQTEAGVLGLPGTSVLFGDTRLNGESQSGGRYTLGIWLNPCCDAGIEATFVGLGEETTRFAASTNEYAILARPLISAQTGVQDSSLVSYEGVVRGSVAAEATTTHDSFELLYRRGWHRGCGGGTDFMLGYRNGRVDDVLRIEESLVTLLEVTPQSTIDLFDQFDTKNRFHGVEMGASLYWTYSPWWSVELLAKVALGNTSSTVTINGLTNTTTATGTTSTAGGVLAQRTNIGRYEQDNFSTITELGVNLRRRLGYSLDFTFGYTFVYWSDVARAGDQIDFQVNKSLIPPNVFSGPLLPEPMFITEGFWAQGLHFGLEYNF